MATFKQHLEQMIRGDELKALREQQQIREAMKEMEENRMFVARLQEPTPEPEPEPKPKPDTPAMPLSDFALPVVGLPVAGRTLPDSGPLGSRPVSTGAAKRVITALLAERRRLTRHGKG